MERCILLNECCLDLKIAPFSVVKRERGSHSLEEARRLKSLVSGKMIKQVIKWKLLEKQFLFFAHPLRNYPLFKLYKFVVEIF
jgi:hypothetical protein